MGLLELPTELRTQILGIALNNVPTVELNDFWEIGGADYEWLPPPILQTCQRLRIEGLQLFVQSPARFRIVECDITHLLRYCAWRDTIYNYYPSIPRQLVYLAVFEFGDIHDPYESYENYGKIIGNMWKWLYEFYVYDVPGQFMGDDFDKTTMAGHAHMGNSMRLADSTRQ